MSWNSKLHGSQLNAKTTFFCLAGIDIWEVSRSKEAFKLRETRTSTHKN
jgi:hypothetical protein